MPTLLISLLLQSFYFKKNNFDYNYCRRIRLTLSLSLIPHSPIVLFSCNISLDKYKSKFSYWYNCVISFFNRKILHFELELNVMSLSSSV